MAVPVFIDAAVTSNATAVGSATPSLPTFAAGDLLVMITAITTAGSSVAAGIDQASIPTWVQHSNNNLPATSGVRGQFFSKIAISGEPAPATTFIGTGGYVIIIASYRGANFVNDAFGVVIHGDSAVPTDATLLTGLADNLILRVMFCDGANITDPDLFPAGTDGRASGEIALPGNGLSLGLADGEQLLPGGSSPVTWDLDASDEWAAYQVAWPPEQPFVAQTAVVSADAPTAVLISDLFFLGQPAWIQAAAPPARILQPEIFADVADVRVDAPSAELTIVAEPQTRLAPVALTSVDAPCAVLVLDVFMIGPTAWVSGDAPAAIVYNEMLPAAPATVGADAPRAALEVIFIQVQIRLAAPATVTVNAPTASVSPDILLKPIPTEIAADAPTAVLIVRSQTFITALNANVAADAPIARLQVDLRLIVINATVAMDAPTAILFDLDRVLFGCTAWVSAVAPPAALFTGEMDAVPADVVLDGPVAVLSVQLDQTMLAAISDVIVDAPVALLGLFAITGPVCADPSVRPQVIANPSIGVC